MYQNSILNGLCQFIGPYIGNGPFTSVLVLIVAAVGIGLWLLSENKEGMIVFIIRAGVGVAALVNVVAILTYFGLANPCPGVIH